jgi:hypothetical protein
MIHVHIQPSAHAASKALTVKPSFADRMQLQKATLSIWQNNTIIKQIYSASVADALSPDDRRSDNVMGHSMPAV